MEAKCANWVLSCFSIQWLTLRRCTMHLYVIWLDHGTGALLIHFYTSELKLLNTDS